MTRFQKKAQNNRGFSHQTKVRVRRIVRLDRILINAARITSRRGTVAATIPTVAPVAAPVAPAPTPRAQNDRPIPLLLPLSLVLKMPARAPFNIRRRKSVGPISNERVGTPNNILPIGTTAQIIMNVINGSSLGSSGSSTPNRPVQLARMSRALSPVAGPSRVVDVNYSPPNFGRLHYDSDSDSD